MLAILSPARNIRPFSLKGVKPGRPLFPKETGLLVDALRNYNPWELESLLDLNPERAFTLYDFYQHFDPAVPGTPALLSYYGAAFRNLNARDFDLRDFSFAQEHLRILSALYGLLRPADGIQPYRLGIKKEFRVNGQELYEFWGDRLYRQLFQSGEPVVSLASADYTRLAAPCLLPGDTLITCRFLVQKPDGARGTVSSVRTARGQMARFLVKHRITEPEGLREFDWEGYRFVEGRSDARNYVFIQDRSRL